MNPSFQGIILFYTRETALKTRKNKSPDLQTESCQSSQGIGNKDLYSQFVSEHGL